MIVYSPKELLKIRKCHSLNIVKDLKRLAVELSETQRSLVNSPLHFHRLGKNIELVRSIITSSGENLENENKTFFKYGFSSNKSASKKEVCPEKFMGKDAHYGFPFFRKGFEGVNCTEFVPIDKLVTIDRKSVV